MTDNTSITKTTDEIFTDVLRMQSEHKIDCSSQLNMYCFEEQIDRILKTQLDAELKQSYIDELKNSKDWTQIHDRFQIFLDQYFPGTHLMPISGLGSTLVLLQCTNVCIPNSKYKSQIIDGGNCTDNVTEFCKKNKQFTAYYGYALSKDRLWRHHSWILDLQSNIIETTSEKKLIYIGMKTSKMFHQ